MTKKRILMICYYYPPLTDVGCKRSVAIAKYLKKFGWSPYVISVKNPDKSYCSLGNVKPPVEVPVEYTYSLFNLNKLSGKINGITHRVGRVFGKKLETNYFHQFFCFPDIFIGWIPLTILKSLMRIKKYRIDIIYVTCTPYSSAIIGLVLKFLTKKKLVIDFRDQRGVGDEELEKKRYLLKFRRNLEDWFIYKVISYADLFTVTSREIKERYLKQIPSANGKINVVYNGFDTDFLDVSSTKSKFSKFTIIYTGDFYFYCLDSVVFFEGLSILKNSGDIHCDNFQFLFYGDDVTRIKYYAKEFGIEDLVAAKHRIPYDDILRKISQSHLQLIRIVKPMISTKVFEGIPLNIPFLATIPEGEVERMIKHFSPSSFIVTRDEAQEVAQAIRKAIRQYKCGEISENRIDQFLQEYSREEQTRRFQKLLETHLN